MGQAQQLTDAYLWARDIIDQPLIPLPSISNPVSDGLDSGLDSVIKDVLDSTGLMGELEKVTGRLDQLSAAAQEWQAQAKAMRNVASELRRGASGLSDEWQGEASDSFGTHMGKVVAAIDSTAADMEQTAQIISQAAAECGLAEQMIIEIIREAIEALIISLAAMVAIDIITLGLATVADALVADAEIEVFIARVARVSEQLAANLEKLMEAVKEMRTAGKSFKTIKDGLKAANNLRKLGGMMGRGKALSELITSPSMERLGDFAATQAVKHYDEIFKGGVAVVTGDGDPVGAVTDGLGDGTNLKAVAGQIDGATADSAEEPYHVPKSSVEEAFG
ncbi:WXG100 family type VII secretion target [Streptomyces sp. NPDC059373]